MPETSTSAALHTMTVEVLSISTADDDHFSLKRISSRPELALYTGAEWTVCPVNALESAVPLLRKNRFPIVVSERDLSPGTWRDVYAEVVASPDPPLLIVSSLLADERLWSEVLNMGAHDVLSKPFDGEEVIRVLSLAWLHRKNRAGRRGEGAAMTAGLA